MKPTIILLSSETIIFEIKIFEYTCTITEVATAASMKYCYAVEITSVNLRLVKRFFIAFVEYSLNCHRDRTMLRQRTLRSDKTLPSRTFRHMHVIVFRIRRRISKNREYSLWQVDISA